MVKTVVSTDPTEPRVRPIRHQWGTDRGTGAAPILPGPPGRITIAVARFALLFTISAWLAYLIEQFGRFVTETPSLDGTLETIAYLLVVTSLAASSSAYLLCRLGYFMRAAHYRRVSRAHLDAIFNERRPKLVAIIPSYREEPRVIRQTLLSAALQEYPNLRITLLIDDPPDSGDPDHAALLAAARSLPRELKEWLRVPSRQAKQAYQQILRATGDAPLATAESLLMTADAYESAATWLDLAAEKETVVDHVDAFLVDEILRRLAEDFKEIASACRQATETGAGVSNLRIVQLARRLVWIFQAEITSFERKQYVSLSHESSKAANLNSYIGLMGGRYRAEETLAGTVLLPVRGTYFSLEVPDPDYVLTLDADSMLLPEYCLRLVAFMEQPANANVAVAQTPYSAYKGAPTRLERLAGATTDIQHIAHQGLTQFGATFWVGANAVIRKVALDQLMQLESHKGFTVKRYIRDRTVIEDTESSLDLRLAGWRLENIPERLSYSATPPDFGALCIQRERWSNGGIIILAKLWRLSRSMGKKGRKQWAELFLRLNYLASITWTSLGLVILLFWPFDQSLLSSLAVLTALPYFLCMASDLHAVGYRWRDMVRIYGFNMMLLPVNIIGTIKSIVQAIGGHKVAFARTPKVNSRTVAPIVFVIAPLLVIDWSAVTLLYDMVGHRYLHAAFAALNVSCTLYAVLAFHGIRNSVMDIFVNLRAWVFREKSSPGDVRQHRDWRTVLYHGTSVLGEPAELPAIAGALAAFDGERSDSQDFLRTGDHVGLTLLLPPAVATDLTPSEEDGQGQKRPHGRVQSDAPSSTEPEDQMAVGH